MEVARHSGNNEVTRHTTTFRSDHNLLVVSRFTLQRNVSDSRVVASKDVVAVLKLLNLLN